MPLVPAAEAGALQAEGLPELPKDQGQDLVLKLEQTTKTKTQKKKTKTALVAEHCLAFPGLGLRFQWSLQKKR